MLANTIRKKILGKKKFGAPIKKSALFLATNLQKQSKNHIFPNISKTNEKIGIFDHILQKADKISEIFKKIHQNRIIGLDFRDFRSLKSVQRYEKTHLKPSFQGRNIIFQEKCLTVTNIIFLFQVGLQFNFWPKNQHKYFLKINLGQKLMVFRLFRLKLGKQ